MSDVHQHLIQALLRREWLQRSLDERGVDRYRLRDLESQEWIIDQLRESGFSVEMAEAERRVAEIIERRAKKSMTVAPSKEF